MEVLRQHRQVHVHGISHANAAGFGLLADLDLVHGDGDAVFLGLFEDLLPDLIFGLVVGVGVFLGGVINEVLKLIVVEERRHQHVNEVHDEGEYAESDPGLDGVHAAPTLRAAPSYFAGRKIRAKVSEIALILASWVSRVER